MSTELTTLLPGLAFGEGLTVARDSIWLSDMNARQIHNLTLSGEPLRTIDTAHRPSGLAVIGETLYAVQMEPRTIIAIAPDNSVRLVADLSAHAEHHLNDMTATADGALFIGNFGDDSAPPTPPRPATLLCVEPCADAPAVPRIAATGMHFANGMAVVDGGRTLLVAETRAQPPRITAFSLDDAHVLTHRRTFAEFSGALMPDGIDAAADGRIAIAMPFAHCVVILDPRGAEIARIPTESHGMPFSVAFAPGGDAVFACVASSWEEEATLRARDGALVVFTVPR